MEHYKMSKLISNSTVSKFCDQKMDYQVVIILSTRI